MGFRFVLFPIFVIANLLAAVALRRAFAHWFPLKYRRVARPLIATVYLLLNAPLAVFFFPAADAALSKVSPTMLRIFFYPSTAWMATLIALLLASIVVLPLALAWELLKRALSLVRGNRRVAPTAPVEAAAPPSLSENSLSPSRRDFLGQSAGVFVAGVYGVAAYGCYSNMGEIDVSRELYVPVPNLPRSLEGLTVVQISDLHVGPYIRQKELEHVVSLVNQLHPDLVAITGDVLDRHLASLPDAVKGLSGLRSNFGVYAVLGNHDYYADRFSSSGPFRGGVKIAQGLASIKIQTLRNQVVHIAEGTDRLALLGLDWLSAGPNDRNFFSYKPVETQRQLKRMLQEAAPEAPKVLLAHHPDTFLDVPAEIGLTLSGHTHGGGQVILGSIDGKPLGIGALRFKYLSGLYQKNGSSLYVNRGIGYLGIPIRINCPPEISRFRLVRAAGNDA